MRDLLPRTPFRPPPVRVDHFEYTERHQVNRYMYYQRDLSKLNAKSKLVFDSDWLKNQDAHVQKMSASPNHEFLAFIESSPSKEQGDIYVYDISGKDSKKV